MATFVQPLLSGVVIFNRKFAPEENRHADPHPAVSVLVSVPKILRVLRDHVMQDVPESRVAPRPLALDGAVVRYRRPHRLFG